MKALLHCLYWDVRDLGGGGDFFDLNAKYAADMERKGLRG